MEIHELIPEGPWDDEEYPVCNECGEKHGADARCKECEDCHKPFYHCICGDLEDEQDSEDCDIALNDISLRNPTYDGPMGIFTGYGDDEIDAL
jgi:hypothetical protein